MEDSRVPIGLTWKGIRWGAEFNPQSFIAYTTRRSLRAPPALKVESIELPKGNTVRSETTKPLLGVARNGEMEKAFDSNRVLVVNVIDA